MFDSDGKFLRMMKIDVPVDRDARPAIGNKPNLQTYQKVMTMAPGAPWTMCITPPPNQVLYTSDAYPGRIYKLTLDGKVLGVFGAIGQAAEAVRLDPRDRLPVGKRHSTSRNC